jgi:hypothetical protein
MTIKIDKISLIPAEEDPKQNGLLEVLMTSEARPDDNIPEKKYEVKYSFSSNHDMFSPDGNYKLDITFSHLDELGKLVTGSIKSDDDFVLFRQSLSRKIEDLSIKSILRSMFYLDFNNTV